ncbi:hypothetical protein NDU88_002425 [Pleurodeles waltl]|uniref:Uncharacterized protein n=1 Tax=Pleurodeles waltl TaxID=8319 RepID=A0AAV7SEQ7_PLEWA|nr:hypothetical protein NDU88_002425 [Pleurodeles waltl]
MTPRKVSLDKILGIKAEGKCGPRSRNSVGSALNITTYCSYPAPTVPSTSKDAKPCTAMTPASSRLARFDLHITDSEQHTLAVLPHFEDWRGLDGCRWATHLALTRT